MLHVRKAKGFTATEELEAPTCNLAKIKLTPGFQANWKWKRNRKSDLLIRIISGSAMIDVGNDGPTFLSTKSQSTIFIRRGVAYRWIIQSKRGVTFYVFATPAWTPDQYEDVT